VPTLAPAARRRAPPSATMRARWADRWLPRYRLALLKVLRAMSRSVASRARTGGRRTMATGPWVKAMVKAKRSMVYLMVGQGFDLAAAEVALAQRHAKQEAARKLVDVGRRATFAPGGSVTLSNEFLLEGKFTDIDLWVNTTSAAEVATRKAMLLEVWAAAEASRDPETGAAWTPREIAKAIQDWGVEHDPARANMLARTGTVWAMNEGAQQRYAAAGVPAMQWWTVSDAARCVFCEGMHGKIVKTSKPFWTAGSKFGVKVPKTGGGVRVRSLQLPFEVQHPPLHPN